MNIKESRKEINRTREDVIEYLETRGKIDKVDKKDMAITRGYLEKASNMAEEIGDFKVAYDLRKIAYNDSPETLHPFLYLRKNDFEQKVLASDSKALKTPSNLTIKLIEIDKEWLKETLSQPYSQN